eukprot:5595964-Amphidinium_carterae.1
MEAEQIVEFQQLTVGDEKTAVISWECWQNPEKIPYTTKAVSLKRWLRNRRPRAQVCTTQPRQNDRTTNLLPRPACSKLAERLLECFSSGKPIKAARKAITSNPNQRTDQLDQIAAKNMQPLCCCLVVEVRLRLSNLLS